jgi:predicted RNase H-like HicB family nuclease
LLRETDGRWIGDIPELPGVTVYGSTPEEATLKAKALALRVIAEEIECPRNPPNQRPCRALAYCGQKMVLTMGSTLLRLCLVLDSNAFKEIQMKCSLPIMSILLVLFAVPAFCSVIDFDDVANPEGAIQNGYNGFNWNNFWTTTCTVPSGYCAGTVSSPLVAYNGYGSSAGLSTTDGTTFTFVSTYLTSAWYDNLAVDIKGYLEGTLVDETNIIPSTTIPTLYSFNWAGIDELTFSTSGGTLHPGYSEPCCEAPSFAMDNFTFQTDTPEPASATLLGGALVGLLVTKFRAVRRSRS